MQLIKEIESRRNNKGRLIKYGEFLCPIDNIIVVRILQDGKRINHVDVLDINYLRNVLKNIRLSR